ncbi:MAG: sporulation protein YunB [Bacillota bacterium]
MRLRKRRARRKAGFALVGVLVVLVLIVAFTFVERTIGPIIYALVEVEAQQIAVEQINRAVADLAGDLQYLDLYRIERDSQDRIVLMQPNTALINRLSAEANLKIVQAMKQVDGHTVYIPIGALTGSRLLANSGPRIPVHIWLIGRVQADIGDKFESAGVNQTRHVLYLDTKASMRMAIPLWTSDITVSAYNPLAEAIIAGQVPQAYMNLVIPGATPQSGR